MQEKRNEFNAKNGMVITCYQFLNKHINFKMGALSGIVAGVIVFAINIEHGFWPAFAGFGKQFAFNLFMAGYNTRSCEKLANIFKKHFVSLVLGSLIPTVQAFFVLYSIHYFGGTPKPMASTLWQVPFNLGIFLFFTLVYRQIINLKRPSFKVVTEFFRVRAVLPVRKINGVLKNRRQAS